MVAANDDLTAELHAEDFAATAEPQSLLAPRKPATAG